MSHVSSPGTTPRRFESDVYSPLVTRPLGTLLQAGVLMPLRIASSLFPRSIWPPLEWICYRGARLVSGLARPLLSQPDDHPLQALMRFNDLAEGLVGVRGQWEVLDGQRAIRRVTHCPHAPGLRRTPEFCTRLGAALGRGLAAGLVKRPSRFEIRATLSQGHRCCEYHACAEH